MSPRCCLSQANGPIPTERIRGEIALSDLQAVFEANAFALVGLDKSIHSKLHEFDNALERIQFSSPLQARYQETCAVIKELRDFLRSSLP